MSGDRHDYFRYCLGRKRIIDALAIVSEFDRPSFIYDCIAAMAINPNTTVAITVQKVLDDWKKYGRV